MLYDPALEAGMTPQEFWDSSLAEIEIRVEDYAKRKARETKERISDMFLLAQLFAERHPPIPFVKYDPKMTMPWDILPEMFEEEKQQAEKKEKQEEFERFKEKRQRYYALYNQRRGGEMSE